MTAADTRRSLGPRVRRWGLATFFASIAVNGALGIYALLAPSFGEIQEKTLATSLFVTGAIVMGLACEPAWERRLLGPVPHAGALLAALGSSMSIAGMWAEIDNEVYGKALGTVAVAATACTVASLLALVELATRHAWVFTTTLGLLAVGATLVGVLPWLEDGAPEAYVRGMGVVLIVLAAFTVTLPVLHWVDRAGVAAERSTHMVRHCPRCGRRVTGAFGVALTCPSCGTRFMVSDVPSAP